MKRQITAAALVLCLLLGLLSGCSRKGGSSGNDDSGYTAADSIYWLSSHPEAESELLAIAEEYESVSGMSVTVKCVSPEEYADTLKSELYSDEPPVIFECDSVDDLRGYLDRCYDLVDSAAAAALTDTTLALSGSGRTLAVPLGTEYCGLLLNRALLKEAGFTEDSINSLDSLRSAAEAIHANADELGFDAFAPALLSNDTAPGFAESLANMALYYESIDDEWAECPATVSGEYLDELRAFWDMYLANSACDTEHIADGSSSPLDDFANGEAVFCIGSSSDAAALEDESISMIPLYFGVNDEQQGLCERCSGYLAINAPAANGIAAETLAFLEWLTGSERGLELMSQVFGKLPYKNAPDSGDRFAELAQSMNKQGKSSVEWVYRLAPNASDWYSVFAHSLAGYSSSGDWERVKSAYIDGWDVQYTASKIAN